jgi:hypothetical protein
VSARNATVEGMIGDVPQVRGCIGAVSSEVVIGRVSTAAGAAGTR